MDATPTSAAAPPKTVSPRHALLESLIGIAARQLNEQFLDFTRRLAGALIDAADASGDVKELQARLRAGKLLRDSHYAFLNLAAKALEKAVRHDIAALGPQAKVKTRVAEQALSLVPYEEMDSKVTLGGISKPFEVAHADQLATLNLRLAALLERDTLRLNQNPFRPEVFIMALQQAWTAFNPDEDAVNLLLPLCRPGMFLDLGPLIDELNVTLQRKGVLPGDVEGARARKAESHDASAHPARKRKQQAELAQQLRDFFSAVQDPAADPDLQIPDLPDIANLKAGAWAHSAAPGSASMPASMPGGAVAGGHGMPAGAANRQPLFTYLAQMQQAGGDPAPYGHGQPVAMAPVVQVTQAAHPTQAAAAPQGAAHPNLLTMLSGANAFGAPQFVQGPDGAPRATGTDGAQPGTIANAAAANVFYLPSIKQHAPQGSLSRADESTIDLLAAVFDAVFRDQNISQEIRDLIRFLQIPVLKAALLDKEFFFQDAHPARRMIDLLSRMGWEQRKSPDDPLFQAMQRSVARVGREHELEASVFSDAVAELEALIKAEEAAAAAAIAEPIAAALKQEKMAVAQQSARQAVALRLGSGDVIAIVETFLENRWTSVLTIAYSVEDDKPGAVGNATQTMDDLIWSVRPKITADERKQLIAKLPKLLATLNKWLDIIKWQDADRLQFFAELAECHASIVRAPLDISPERQLEISLAVAQQAAERRLAEQAAAAVPAAVPDEAPPPAPPAGPLDNLARGMWFEFDEADGDSVDGSTARTVKLAWISPLRTLFIFSTAARQEAFSLSGDALAARLAARTARIARSDGVVSRALSQAMGAMAA